MSGIPNKKNTQSLVPLGAALNLSLFRSHPQFLSEGYAAHLSALEFEHGSRPKKNRMILRQGSFGLSSKPDFLSPSPDFLACKRTPLLRRAMSMQQASPPSSSSSTPKPERAQSQPESHRDGPEIRIEVDDPDQETGGFTAVL